MSSVEDQEKGKMMDTHYIKAQWNPTAGAWQFRCPESGKVVKEYPATAFRVPRVLSHTCNEES